MKAVLRTPVMYGKYRLAQNEDQKRYNLIKLNEPDAPTRQIRSITQRNSHLSGAKRAGNNFYKNLVCFTETGVPVMR